MPATLIQKLIGRRVGHPVQVGDIVQLPVDLAWGSEMTVKFAIDVLRSHPAYEETWEDAIRDNSRSIAFPFDHLVPAGDVRTANLLGKLREFAGEHGIRVFDIGYDGGIQHRLFEERGFLYPGAVGVGADSHSCAYGALSAIATGIGSTDLAAAMLSLRTWMKVPESIRVELRGQPRASVSGKDIVLYLLGILGVDGATYQSLEYCGDGVGYLDMAARFTIANMAVEAGAKFGLFPADRVTHDYLEHRVAVDFPDEVRFDLDAIRAFPELTPDADADYTRRITIDLDQLEPMVALPHLPENCFGIHQLQHVLTQYAGNRRAEFADDLVGQRLGVILDRVDDAGRIPIQQVFIGSCTNARIEDLRVAAQIMRGKRLADGVRTVVIPASQHVFRQATREGLMETFLDAGCHVESSSCGPCIGFKSGVLGPVDTAVFTSNRNFLGRCGDKNAAVILASPAVAAASAVAGYLAAPDEVGCYYDDPGQIESRLADYCDLRRTIMAAADAIYYQAPITDLDPQRSGAEGHAAWCFGDHVNTDLIMPARYCNITDPDEYKQFLMADAGNEAFLEAFRKSEFLMHGAVMVAGRNFGCGSSRESAPMGIRRSGLAAVIAHSFARIFFRNAINIGLPVFQIGDAAYRISQDDQLELDFSNDRIHNISRGETYQARPLGEFTKGIRDANGLINYVCQTSESGIGCS